MIIKDCKRGVSQRKIAQKYEVSKSAVQKLYKKFLNTETVADRSARGRTRSTNWRDNGIIRMMKNDLRTTVRNLRKLLILSISDGTVRRRLQETDLQSRFAAQNKPLISEKNRRKRLDFARKYLYKDFDFWKETIFMDESKFNIFHSDGKITVWR
ncbi:Transposable element Tcb1 transposase [Anthophora quadrimaculata]